MSPSPTPWSANKSGYIYDAQRIGVIEDCDYDGDYFRNPESNGPFIVHRVNNHDALVKALGDTLALLESQETRIDGEWGDCRNLEEIEKDGDLSPEIIQARTVLTNAKKQP